MKHFVRLLLLVVAVSLISATAYASNCPAISDILLAGNTGPNGSLEIFTFSDPNLVAPGPNGQIYWNGNLYGNSGISTCEDSVKGGSLNLGINGTLVGFTWYSDGESYFDPCGANIDTSDCIDFGNGLKPTYTSGWFPLPNGNAWIVPSAIPNCGQENEPTCEPVGYFLFAGTSGLGANAYAVMYEAPEPSSLILLGSGLVGLAGVVRRRLF